MILLRHLKAGYENAESCGTFRHILGLGRGKTMGVDFLWDFGAALFVGLLVSGPLLFLGFESATDRAVLMRDLGIPAGLLGSLIGTQNMINSAAAGALAADWIYGWTGLLFLTTLYGGAFSALGFFLSGSGRPEAKTIQNRGRLWRGKLICLLALGPWVGNAIYHGGGLGGIFSTHTGLYFSDSCGHCDTHWEERPLSLQFVSRLSNWLANVSLDRNPDLV